MKRLLVVSLGVLSIATASVLETNDVKMNNLLGLGGNPAVIAVNKKVNFEAGTVAINQNKQNAKLLNSDTSTTGSLFNGRNQNDMNFADASRFFWFAGNIGDDWFGIRHTNISNVYPFGSSQIQLIGAAKVLQNIKDPYYQSKVTIFQKDSVETFSLIWAKELTKGYSAGIELATNRFTPNKNTLYNTEAEQRLGKIDQYEASASKPYYSATFGLVQEIDAANKISFAHKMTQDRNVHYNNDAGTAFDYTEKMPNETALSYIYKVTNAWEIAATCKSFWGVSYTTTMPGINSDTNVTKRPYNLFGVATDYRLNDKWAFQGWANNIRNYKKIEIGDNTKGVDEMDRGYNVTQIGGNIQYSLNVIKGGTILLGSYVSKIQSEDKAVGRLFDITNTTLSYSQNF